MDDSGWMFAQPIAQSYKLLRLVVSVFIVSFFRSLFVLPKLRREGYVIIVGIELKPGGKPVSFRVNNDRKLVVTRATLGEGLGKEKSVIQYLIGGDKNSSVNLCALYPNEKESCSLSLVFERDVDFTVIGDRGILLTGYLQTDKGQTCVQDKGKYVNCGVLVEEKKEDGKSYKRFLKNSIFTSKNLSDRHLASKFRDPPPGSCVSKSPPLSLYVFIYFVFSSLSLWLTLCFASLSLWLTLCFALSLPVDWWSLRRPTPHTRGALPFVVYLVKERITTNND
ncbi:unnamed protein product [Arabidopsis halleri]